MGTKGGPMKDFTKKLMKLISQHDCHEDFIWDEDLNFSINCEDIFVPGEDWEKVEEADYDLLESTLKEVDEIEPGLAYVYGVYLFVARKHQLRPLSGFLNQLNREQKLKQLFLEIPQDHEAESCDE